MKITVDTNVDKHDDIKKVITMLNHLIAENEAASHQEQPEGLFGMFNEPKLEPEVDQESSEQPADMFAMFNNNDEPKPEVIQNEEPEYQVEPSSEPQLNAEHFNVDNYIEKKKKNDEDNQVRPYS